MTGSRLPDRGAKYVPADVGVQIVDMLPVGTSRQSQLETARRQLAERQRAMAITQLADADEDDTRLAAAKELSRFTVRDAHGAMRYLIFHDGQPALGLGARLTIKQGCAVHRDVLVASASDVRVDSRGTELSLEQQIWRLERP